MQIFKTTCGQNVLISDENVTENITSNSISPLELMEIYSAVITPRNNVPGYVNGPRREIKGYRIMYNVNVSCIICMLVNFVIIILCREIHIFKWDDFV